MIHYLKHENIDKTKWDLCIAQSPQGILYAQSWYLDIVSPGWDALITEHYEAVFPLTWKSKFGIKYLYQPDFTQQLGLFVSGSLLSSPELLAIFLKAIPEELIFAEINLNAFWQAPVGFKDIAFTEKLTHHLDLVSPYEILFKNYSTNLKRNLTKGNSEDFEIIHDADISQIIHLFVKNKAAAVGGFNETQSWILQRLIEKGKELGVIQCWGISFAEGVMEAGAVFAEGNGNVIFLFSGASKRSRELGSMPLLIDRFISRNSGRNLILDFEGSMDKNLARFYKSFGSKESVYLHLRYNRLPFWLRWAKS